MSQAPGEQILEQFHFASSVLGPALLRKASFQAATPLDLKTLRDRRALLPLLRISLKDLEAQVPGFYFQGNATSEFKQPFSSHLPLLD